MHPVFKDKNALINEKQYEALYQQSIQNPDAFWSEQANRLTWYKPWEKVLINTEWFINGKLNACYNCLDRHLPQRQDQIAILWESDDPNHSLQITYAELFEKVCRLANVLKNFHIKKGDRVCIYLPMIPEAIIAMLACARIGAIHSVVFGGFSAESLQNRIIDAKCTMVITANEGLRGNKIIPLKKNVDIALKNCPSVKKVIVVNRTQNTIDWHKERDHWYHEELEKVSADCPCEEMDANDPLFILYTSGSTGKPKGIVHSIGGYLVYVAITHQFIFDYREKEIYWCTADVGWITGHSYTVYGPLCNGATTLIFEGVPHYPDASRFWNIVDKHQVSIFYTAPTAIRALRQEGDAFVKRTQRKSLRILGTVGEPINPEVWKWYFDIVGEKRCPIVDTWWQTETGGILISPFPYATALQPGSVSKPFFGIQAKVVDGKLIITHPWPGMMKTVYGDHERFVSTYFQEFPGNYSTGDNARCDENGYFWITGRNDDVLKISGHRIGTAEIESALLQHPSVAEAAVVGVPHPIKGETIYAFVTLKSGIKPTENLKKELIQQVKTSIGAIAIVETIQWAAALPKTRSGKIMRRLLRKIANQDLENLGDISTLADASVVENLIKNQIHV